MRQTNNIRFAIVFMLLTVPLFGHTYTTKFSSPPAPENPISESNNWINGKANGLDWQDVHTTNNFAFGTQSGATPPPYDDSTAILTGSWGNNQDASAVVHLVNKTDKSQEEVEIRLRSNLSAHSSNGYEFQWGGNKVTKSLCYTDIVRWNGPLNSFASLGYSTGSQFCLNDGDTVRATAVGSTLTMYINGVQVKQVSDSKISSGNPGIGFYLENDSGSPSNSDFGFSSFTVTDGPAAPSGLTDVVH